jgi:D-lactate dehydrogenase
LFFWFKGKTLGIIGTGKIGKNVGRIASSGFLMNVLAYDPYPEKDVALENHFSYTNLKTLLKKSDIITLHCPLLDSTKHLINKAAISTMKKGVVIVNTSRGGVIDTNALIHGLKSKKISYALLDVLEHEDNLKGNKLVKFPNVIITPHIAFYADDSMRKMYSEAFATIKSFIKKKEIINQVKGS